MNVHTVKAEWHQHRWTILGLIGASLWNLALLGVVLVTVHNQVSEHDRWIQEQKAERLAERMRLVEQAVVVQHERDDNQDQARKETLTALKADLSDLKGLVMQILQRKP